MKPCKYLFRLVTACGLLWSLSLPAAAHEWLEQCTIRFENEFALSNLYAHARATFTYPTGRGTDGDLEICNESHGVCWMYRERCGIRGYVNVDIAPVGSYSHYHLGFQDTEIDCYAAVPDAYGAGAGRGDFSDCTPADWKREPRVAATHDGNQWLKIWIGDRVTNEPRIFDIASIRIRGSRNAQIWFQSEDGVWWHWSSLPPGRWGLRDYVNNVRAVYVRGSATTPGSVEFDDIVVRN
jgi:hypothetical protein